MKDRKWLAAIYQEYTGPRGGRTSVSLIQNGMSGTQRTQVVDLRLRASSAQEACDKAEAWLKASGIINAYVSEVCLDGMPSTELTDIDEPEPKEPGIDTNFLR